LLRARAVETQCYVIAAAQTGEHWPGGRRSYGDAMIVDPWGKVVARCGQASDTFALADIDLEYVRQVRRDMPLWTQRRNDVRSLRSRMHLDPLLNSGVQVYPEL
jgi:predicted amidohydrolase